ncbi:MAG: DUF86 domain-containing protein [Candidatus Paceibacterota bacterium]|jgi:uncharacterized protein YutE (UPF0331/DUF86 family)
MTNFAIIENKVSSIKKYLSILNGYQKYTRLEIETTVDLRGAIERYLYLAIQATIDLAEAVISFKNLRKPSTLSESFDILAENNLLDATLTEKLVKMTGFRNLVAHDYERLNYDIVYDILQNRLGDLEEFIKQIEKIN